MDKFSNLLGIKNISSFQARHCRYKYLYVFFFLVRTIIHFEHTISRLIFLIFILKIMINDKARIQL